MIPPRTSLQQVHTICSGAALTLFQCHATSSMKAPRPRILRRLIEVLVAGADREPLWDNRQKS